MSTTAAKLRDLEAALLVEKTRYERARANIAEIELANHTDKERDRLVGTGKLRVLNFWSGVTPGMVEEAIDALEHWRRRDSGEPVTIRFYTPGGDIISGLALYDAIQRLRREGHHVTTHGIGMVASMGAILMQAGDERVMDARAKMLIHAGSLVAQGSMGEVEDQLVLSKMLRDDLYSILAERSTLSKTQIVNRSKRKDWWFGADEALKLGFIDRVE